MRLMLCERNRVVVALKHGAEIVVKTGVVLVWKSVLGLFHIGTSTCSKYIFHIYASKFHGGKLFVHYFCK